MTDAQKSRIQGGFVLLSRKLLNSGLMEKPPLYLKLWVWMLTQASFKDHGDLKRGQFFTSLKKMREAMSYMVGYRTERPTIKEIRGVNDFLMKAQTIATMKVTHGLLITILNYEYYQDWRNYEGHDEGQGQGQTRGRIPRKKGIKKGKTPQKSFSSDSDEFRLSSLLLSLITNRKPDLKRPNLQAWAKSIDLMIRSDGRAPEKIEAVIRWCQADSFWQSNILSTGKLREKFDQLELQMNRINSKAPN